MREGSSEDLNPIQNKDEGAVISGSNLESEALMEEGAGTSESRAVKLFLVSVWSRLTIAKEIPIARGYCFDFHGE